MSLGAQQEQSPATSPPPHVAWGYLADESELAGSRHVMADPGAALRVSDAQTTMARIEPYLADYGITRVAHLTGLDRVGIPVHTAHKPAGKSLSNGSGKGVTPQASRVGAIMEAVEQTYWEDQPIERITASRNELESAHVSLADPWQLPFGRGNLYHDDLPIQWTSMTDIASGETVLVPADLVGLPWRVNAKRIATTHISSSNGLASGGNVVEAMLSGLTEVMERDSLAMQAASRADYYPTECLNLDELCATFGEPLTGLVDRLNAADLWTAIYDCTDELGLPTFKCMIAEQSSGGAGTFGGYGANLDPEIAIVRAVTEAVQARCLIIAGARDDQFRCGRDAARLASRQARITRSDPVLPAPQYSDESTGSLIADVEKLVAMLNGRGLGQVLLYRYTNVHDPVQVVRVVVPGLEGYMFSNYVPGPRAQAVIDRRKAGAYA